jgi:hypothetical protein
MRSRAFPHAGRPRRNSGEGLYPRLWFDKKKAWILAFAGMTGWFHRSVTANAACYGPALGWWPAARPLADAERLAMPGRLSWPALPGAIGSALTIDQPFPE